MDYGKLAYLKAVDLENRLPSYKQQKIAVNVFDFKDIPSGTSELTSIEGSGDIAVFAKCSAEAVFYVNGVRVCEGKDVFFKVSDTAKISVSSNVKIESLRIMVLGYIGFSDIPTEVRADCDGEQIAYLICNNGRATAYVSQLDPFAPIEYFAGEFKQGDICLRAGKVILAVIDSEGSIVLFSDGQKSTYRMNAERVAINADDFSVTLAYLRNGGLYYFSVNKLWDPHPPETALSYSGYIDDLKLVKRGDMVVFSSGGKCYAKELPPSRKAGDDKLYIRLKAEVL